MFDAKRVSYFILSLILSAIIVCILWHANWILGDDIQFINTTAIGKPSRAWTGCGRFWPFGLIDYSILNFIPYGHTVTAHFIHNSIIMVMSVFFLFSFMNKITNQHYFISTFFILILFSISSFLQIHINCIYSERMMFFTLSAFMLCYWNGEKSQSTKYYMLALLSAIYATYLKEPVFGLLAIIASVNLIFQRKKLSKKDRIFNYSLLINSAIYLCIYIYRLFFKNACRKGLYNDNNLSRYDTVKALFSYEHILYFLFAVFIVRAYFVLIKKDKEQIFLDGLLFAAVGYVCAICLLHISGNYYMFPSIILALPSFAYWTSHFWKNNKQLAAGVLILSILLIKDSIIVSKTTVIDTWKRRENEMPIINDIASQYLNGKELIWVDKQITDKWLFDVYDDFINYCLKNKMHTIKRCDDPDKIPRNAIIMRPLNSKVALTPDILKNLRLIANINCTEIYFYNTIQ